MLLEKGGLYGFCMVLSICFSEYFFHIFRMHYVLSFLIMQKSVIFCKKCLTSPCGSGILNKLSQGIASEILKKKSVFRKFKLTVDNRLNLW